eukprot:CAMPEP_0114128332 /NCGR_PEP_ID=MMETSP0043_2-20121206/10874_1 /TAXON_ID=464988 /ORGANISM="Hemiselmis andersenii, Strain CCMP644" /LENGTH=168 /DNA_ID=CAMNT_0001221511 /DNA_START=62 /DNA_END=564 /DNA_ORIENTATION=-
MANQHHSQMRWSPLQHAAYRGDVNKVQSLLVESGANPDEIDSLGRTILIHAAAQGHEEVVRALLAAGADVNFAPTTGDGRTALHWAAANGHRGCCELLQAAGADGTAEDMTLSTPEDLSVRAGGDFIVVPDSNPITLLELRDARIRVDSNPYQHPNSPLSAHLDAPRP